MEDLDVHVAKAKLAPSKILSSKANIITLHG